MTARYCPVCAAMRWDWTALRRIFDGAEKKAYRKCRACGTAVIVSSQRRHRTPTIARAN